MRTWSFILLSMLVLGFGVACNSNDESNEIKFESVGIITGSDQALCLCCGGWLINIEGDQKRRNFSELPQGSEIDLRNANFPLSVKLNWSESNCLSMIIIEDIELN